MIKGPELASVVRVGVATNHTLTHTQTKCLLPHTNVMATATVRKTGTLPLITNPTAHANGYS